MCMNALPASMHMLHVCAWCLRRSEVEGRGQKRVLDPLELELGVVVSHCVGAGS